MARKGKKAKNFTMRRRRMTNGLGFFFLSLLLLLLLLLCYRWCCMGMYVVGIGVIIDDHINVVLACAGEIDERTC